MNKVAIQFFGFLFTLLFLTQTVAQERKHLERKWAREGNISAVDSNFAQADTLYRRSLLIRDFDTNRYNLALALMGLEKYDEAEKEWEHLLKQSDDNRLRSLVAYNASHCALAQQKTDKAKEFLKTALRERGDNAAARHNLWLLMSQPEPPEQDNQDNQQSQEDQDNQESPKDKESQQNQDKEENQDDQEGQDDKESQVKQGDQEEKNDQEKDSGKESEQADDDKENKEEESGSKDDQEDTEEEQESEDAQENEDQSEDGEERNEDQPSSSDEASGNEEENTDAVQESTASGEINPQDAQRLLQAIEEAEAQTRERVRKKEWKGKEKSNEKDW